MQFDNDKALMVIADQGVLAKDLPEGLKSGEMLPLKGTSMFYFDNEKIIGIYRIR
jgi:hypothetical protein